MQKIINYIKKYFWCQFSNRPWSLNTKNLNNIMKKINENGIIITVKEKVIIQINMRKTQFKKIKLRMKENIKNIKEITRSEIMKINAIKDEKKMKIRDIMQKLKNIFLYYSNKVIAYLERHGFLYRDILAAFLMSSMLLVLFKIFILSFGLYLPFYINLLLYCLFSGLAFKFNLLFYFREFIVVPTLKFLLGKHFYRNRLDGLIDIFEDFCEEDAAFYTKNTFLKTWYYFFIFQFYRMNLNIFFLFILIRLFTFSHPIYSFIIKNLTLWCLLLNEFQITACIVMLLINFSIIFMYISDLNRNIFKENFQKEYNINLNEEKLKVSFINGWLMTFWSLRHLNDRSYNYIVVCDTAGFVQKNKEIFSLINYNWQIKKKVHFLLSGGFAVGTLSNTHCREHLFEIHSYMSQHYVTAIPKTANFLQINPFFSNKRGDLLKLSHSRGLPVGPNSKNEFYDTYHFRTKIVTPGNYSLLETQLNYIKWEATKKTKFFYEQILEKNNLEQLSQGDEKLSEIVLLPTNNLPFDKLLAKLIMINVPVNQLPEFLQDEFNKTCSNNHTIYEFQAKYKKYLQISHEYFTNYDCQNYRYVIRMHEEYIKVFNEEILPKNYDLQFPYKNTIIIPKIDKEPLEEFHNDFFNEKRTGDMSMSIVLASDVIKDSDDIFM